ncbi:phage tail protein I [Stenomitos frigidus]|uniref:Phage tail protein I n=1 Tax=Stenomitos frigidus ULC18 TaxID=2107698 RepID=A0A2T1ENV4_9CYAN|nr:phage tail protein I [Stenomitos frigidus]PSB34419.1 phage tail protein I [Stenomitos frigidus ULC18]
MTSTSNIPVSNYLDYLPAVLQEDPFLGQFLQAFEAILSGDKQAYPNGFEQTLTDIHTKFAPATTPTEFLPWLAGWVALSLRDDWNEKVKRDFIQSIVPLYQRRGTTEALKKILQIYLQRQVEPSDKSSIEYVEIFEFDQIPYYFQVQLRVDNQDLAEYDRKETIARAIIEQEKPAYTVYSLRILLPSIRLVSEEMLKEMLKKEGVSEAEIPNRRLKLFKSPDPESHKEHHNRTILGTTDQKPKS